MKIFKGRGTPDPEAWPGVKDLSGYKADFPKYQGESLARLVKGLDDEGLDLCEKMLKSNPAERITAKEALKHPYFADVPDEVKNFKVASV